VLNLESDLELAGESVDPLAVVRDRPALAAPLLGTLVPRGDLVLDGSGVRADDLPGRAFSPTPRALERLRSAGARPPSAPPLEVLQRVASRAFSAELGLGLPGARLAKSLAEVADVVRQAPRSGSWLLRRVYGFAGKGRLLVRAGELTPGGARFVSRALELGAVLVEPWVEIELDASMHGFLAPEVTLGVPTIAEVGAGGVWRASRVETGELSGEEVSALEVEARRVADALRRAGYSGPFGIDGFRHREGEARRFVARCDLNPRYTMGWAVGMGDRRPDLD